MYQCGDGENPDGLENEEQFRRYDRIADHEAVSYAKQHLRTGQRNEQNITIRRFHLNSLQLMIESRRRYWQRQTG